MRALFGSLLNQTMDVDSDVWLLTGDLGFGVLDLARQNHPDRSYNVGAAEQLMLGAAVGLAHCNKIPICYSISPFVIYRPFEYLRNFLDHENTPVKLVGAGRDKDYGNLGFSHWAEDDEKFLSQLPNIVVYKPKDDDELKGVWNDFIYNNKPCYLNLKRN